MCIRDRTKNVVLGEKVTAQIQMANATEFTNNDASHSALDYTKHVWVYTPVSYTHLDVYKRQVWV